MINPEEALALAMGLRAARELGLAEHARELLACNSVG